MTKYEAIALQIRLEGGEANLKGDPGGHTKYGITQRTLDAWRVKHPEFPENVADLTPQDAAVIYEAIDWALFRGDDLPKALAPLVLNIAVNMGEPHAVSLLQEVVGINPTTGFFGAQTLAAVQGWHSPYMPEQTIAEEYAAHAAVAYAKLYAVESQFELGWLRRLFRVYTLAVSS